MSGEIAIRAEELGKKYVIGHESEGNQTMRDAILRAASGFGRSLGDMVQGRAIVRGDKLEEFWALRNLDFEVRRGEALGVIGRNGAGKSTLLKVISRITQPTKGCVTINGRVSSLLEVGTGFHPELTGRENIYLNGAILGMQRAEIRKKFDEIVAFAGVERFLDTPVKRYSSGMYVRLAFSVAAHLEPEILIVDEVLAVGDVEFQKKCLGRMQNVAGEGRTVLFVSHNLQAVERLCTRAIVLNKGELAYNGSVTEARRLYLAGARSWVAEKSLDEYRRQGSGEVRFTDIEFMDASGRKVAQLPAGEEFTIRLFFEAKEAVRRPQFGFALLSADGVRLFNSGSSDANFDIDEIRGVGAFDVCVTGLTLATGHFHCNISVSDQMGRYYDYITELPLFDSVSSDQLPNRRSYKQGASGIIFADVEWHFRDQVPGRKVVRR